MANKTLDAHKFLDMSIPVPSIEVQQRVTERLDILHNHVVSLKEAEMILTETMQPCLSGYLSTGTIGSESAITCAQNTEESEDDVGAAVDEDG